MFLLSGTLVVARDIAHAKLQERIDSKYLRPLCMQLIFQSRTVGGEGLPQYMKDYPVYYAGYIERPASYFIAFSFRRPAKTPTGYASGSFGPTTAGFI
jgi:fumarate hydratase, class I